MQISFSNKLNFSFFPLETNTVLVLGGNQAFRSDMEVLDISKASSICTKPPDFPEQYSKGAIAAYTNMMVSLCGGWVARKECHEYSFGTHLWTKAPYSLESERAEASGAMLDNGSWLIIGGKGIDRNPLYTTELLNGGYFDYNLPWPEAVAGHCVEKLNSSHLFVAGGESKNAQLLDSAYFINADSSFWVSTDEKLKYKRSGHVCGVIDENGKHLIVVAGGLDIVEVELLDIVSIHFRPGPNLPFVMDSAAGIKTGSSFYVVGGEHIGYCSKPYLCFSSDAIFEIDVKNFVWKELNQTLKLPRSKHHVLLIEDGSDNRMCQESCPTCKGM